MNVAQKCTKKMLAGSTAMHIRLETGATFLDPAGRWKSGDGVTVCWENLNTAANNAIDAVINC